jgi:uncharacterized protein (DUF2164 family)
MSDIEFTNEEKDILVGRIKRYFDDELGQEIAQFDALFLLDFFSQQIGPYFYNCGVRDAQVLLQSKIETITEGFYEIEKPTEFIK